MITYFLRGKMLSNKIMHFRFSSQKNITDILSNDQRMKTFGVGGYLEDRTCRSVAQQQKRRKRGGKIFEGMGKMILLTDRHNNGVAVKENGCGHIFIN